MSSKEFIDAQVETLSHNELEKADIRLESKIDSILLSINGENGINQNMKELKTQVKFTNGKVRTHQIWIAGIVGGAAVFMALVPTTIFFLKDYFIDITAKAVVEQISNEYEIIIEE